MWVCPCTMGRRKINCFSPSSPFSSPLSFTSLPPHDKSLHPTYNKVSAHLLITNPFSHYQSPPLCFPTTLISPFPSLHPCLFPLPRLPAMRFGILPLSLVSPLPELWLGSEGVLQILPGSQQLQLSVKVQVTMDMRRRNSYLDLATLQE